MTLPARRLARLASLPARPFRLRMIDAVTLAAIGLLVLKVTALMAGDGPARPDAPLPEFARVLAKARSNYTPSDPQTTGSVSTPPKPEPKAEPAAPPVYQPSVPEPVSESERALLEKLATRRDTLKQRQDTLDLREQLLKDAERKLETGVAGLKEAEDKIGADGAKRVEAEKAGLKGIVTMYETMKPKDAARVFDRLNLETLVPIVLAMNPRKMAEVLALMGSEPAEKLTVALANRARGLEAPQVAASTPGLPPGELPAIDPGPAARAAR
ncbi:MotE family protein [Methylorubrum populi]